MIVLKIGGGASINIPGIVADIAELQDQLIIIHGGNYERDTLASRLNIPINRLVSLSGVSSVESTDALMDLMMMAYSGLVNKRLVEACQKAGINAIGLSGIDGGLVRGRRNRGIRARVGDKKKVIRDLSGRPLGINANLLINLLDQGYIPVITVPILDEKGVAINTDNDEIVSVICRSMNVDQVIFLIEEIGLLRDSGDPRSLIKMMGYSEVLAGKEYGGRIGRKLIAISKMLEVGISKVYISDGRVNNPLRHILNGGECTIISQ